MVLSSIFRVFTHPEGAQQRPLFHPLKYRGCPLAATFSVFLCIHYHTRPPARRRRQHSRRYGEECAGASVEDERAWLPARNPSARSHQRDEAETSNRSPNRMSMHTVCSVGKEKRGKCIFFLFFILVRNTLKITG
jgi:hypothetical protein